MARLFIFALMAAVGAVSCGMSHGGGPHPALSVRLTATSLTITAPAWYSTRARMESRPLLDVTVTSASTRLSAPASPARWLTVPTLMHSDSFQTLCSNSIVTATDLYNLEYNL